MLVKMVGDGKCIRANQAERSIDCISSRARLSEDRTAITHIVTKKSSYLLENIVNQLLP